MSLLRTEQLRLSAREDRPRYLARRYASVLRGRVLDLGCDEAVLRGLLAEAAYLGVDRGADADLQLDLDSVERLPFDDRSFDAVVCADVLEHLDCFHAMFEELVRVARRHLIISLPNAWNAARLPIARGRGSFRHYGLPLDPPADRHRWFFSLSEAREFFEGRAERHGLVISDLVALEKPRLAPLVWWRRLRHPGMRYLDRYAHTLVCHYEINDD